MLRFTPFALTFSLTLSLALPGLAQAQVANCGNALAIESVSYGTERVTRDPRNPDSRDLVTLSVGVRNVSPAPVNFTAGFSFRGTQQNFLTGQSWTLAPGARTTMIVANVLKPGAPESTVRALMQFTCR